MCMFRAKAAGRPWPGGQGLGDGRLEVYIDENNGIDVELIGPIIGWRSSAEAAGTAKIGKCFHTGNMGFPLPG
jgi:hypothetical protein